jgi:uncharacterized protein (TIGR03083 family)
MAIRDMVVSEQKDLFDLLSGLEPAAWDRPTLCDDWRVKDVVAHLISMGEAGLPGLLQATVSMSWFNASAVRRMRSATPAQLLAAFPAVMGTRGLGRVVPPSAMLVEVVAHGQDICRPLGLSRSFPADLLRVLLSRAVSPASYVPGFGFTGGRRRARGLRLQATDIGWRWGSGPEVTGDGEAVLMAVLGRPSALTDLAGEGVPALACRMGVDPP